MSVVIEAHLSKTSPTDNGYVAYWSATLPDEQYIRVPMVWTKKDLTKHRMDDLFKQLTQNGFEALEILIHLKYPNATVVKTGESL